MDSPKQPHLKALVALQKKSKSKRDALPKRPGTLSQKTASKTETSAEKEESNKMSLS